MIHRAYAAITLHGNPYWNCRWSHVTVDRCLLSDLLPGPVTVVFERRPELNTHLNPRTSLVGVRVPDHGFVRDLVRHCGHPLALTSANVSSAPSTVAIQVKGHQVHLLGIDHIYFKYYIQQPSHKYKKNPARTCGTYYKP